MSSIEVLFFADDIMNFNNLRITHLDSLKFDWSDKTVLELGCGPGIISKYFYDKGVDIYPVEGRQDIVDFVKKQNKNSKIMKYDLTEDDWSLIPKCDITIAYGILYHIQNPLKFIDNIYEKTNNFCVIETVVSLDTNEDGIYNLNEGTTHTQAIDGIGCRPTRNILWNYMKTKFAYVYMPLTQTRHIEFPSQFNVSEYHTARFVIIGSKIPLNNELLSSSFVSKYNK